VGAWELRRALAIIAENFEGAHSIGGLLTQLLAKTDAEFAGLIIYAGILLASFAIIAIGLSHLLSAMVKYILRGDIETSTKATMTVRGVRGSEEISVDLADPSSVRKAIKRKKLPRHRHAQE
jgi:hypothetical protein